ncbi:MAG: hypothetical protein ACTHJ1_16160 [Bordetella sp.]|uniref:hypothetical protein n=1 Tax=Bordetella sp. TaxID=28081 RepID=UPI003F7C7D62
MQILTDLLRRQWTLPLTAALAVAAAMLPSDAGAQGRTGTATGPSNGTLGGGANGASNRGGAGGVSNPSPGSGTGASANGGAANGRTPQATESSRQGYLGGRTAPAVTPPDTPPGTSPTVPSAPLMALPASLFGKCTHSAALASPQARLSGNNLARIDALADGLMPGAPQSALTARYLLADMQAELEKPDPDPLLAGTYLGMVSVRPVTEELVAVVGESLCAPPLPPNRARAIAAIAEAQRLKQRPQSGAPTIAPKP